ncbi:RNA-binding protein musashi/mRNA cleavage and polyadenylation factor I complex subunit HRP1 protein [Dioscorea alata]|uniref:RNA-binding protein musashi/mRNA cleavage and polyadenylation factor I complex subunit HRP1 protein n=2 Tax=Dioscorea alata TaxID=55571 RepID=A0ACB7UJ15_DIOAL|nr:RNA-binding protein musashi/mRNA cleavage and polyadenylation factor I complex subunit HRP1 protein [Dioscorea alata]KAH7660349.1 RNA-binding protein musashi/mRNA cleavage and polyadenylation factor I complex subunit HRP1 protein [Dioscorea alata]
MMMLYMIDIWGLRESEPLIMLSGVERTRLSTELYRLRVFITSSSLERGQRSRHGGDGGPQEAKARENRHWRRRPRSPIRRATAVASRPPQKGPARRSPRQAAFSTHGDIEEGAVITDKATGKSRGYGFITYRHMESAQRALQEPSKLIDGRLAVCNLACEGLSSGSVSTDLALRKIYIGGLSPEISSETLLKFFGRHGEIEEGSVAYDKETTKSKGFGFVTYKTVEAAKKALDDPNKSLGGRNITVKLADSHKSKVIQTQAPMSMAPLALPYQHGFAQQGKSHAVSPDPVGYASYTHGLPSYPTAYGNAPSGFANQPQTSYMGLKKDQPGLPSTTTGVTGYSFYAAKP